ncbi:MAG: DUF222 domain-containing protein [Actinomycetota bacterium]|nr:DUF222 domain-containing protein [Actinomycetota bacterium]
MGPGRAPGASPPSAEADAVVPTTGGERPHLVLTVDLETLERRAGRPCQLDRAGVLTPQAARRLACDASLSRVIMAGPTEAPGAGAHHPGGLAGASAGAGASGPGLLLCGLRSSPAVV